MAYDDWHLEWIKIERKDRPAILFQYNNWVKQNPIYIQDNTQTRQFLWIPDNDQKDYQ